MNIFKTDKIMNRLNKMIDNAIAGNPIEVSFDETKISALETKLSHYLAMNNTKKDQLSEEKMRINELISDISHQTKTPIANILLYSQLLEESNLPPKEHEFIKALVGQAESLNFLIASLVKTSRLETGIISLSPKETPVKIILDSVIQLFLPKAECKSIALIVTPSPISAVFDPKWTVEAVGNIIDNAVKYTPIGGNICVTVTAYQLFCRIDVSDNGIGISEEDTAKIFSRFYRSQATKDEDGVGIGLYLARKIITDQGGYIKVNSTLKKGSLFSIFLPMSN